MKLMQSARRLGATGMAVAAIAVTAGCAKVNDASLSMVSTSASGYLVVSGQLLKGDVVLVPDRTGRVTFLGTTPGGLSCAGGMRYTASRGSTVDLRCSDGAEVGIQVSMLSETRGYGYGALAGQTVSLVFGLSGADSRAYLRLPPGMTLGLKAETGELELK